MEPAAFLVHIVSHKLPLSFDVKKIPSYQDNKSQFKLNTYQRLPMDGSSRKRANKLGML